MESIILFYFIIYRLYDRIYFIDQSGNKTCSSGTILVNIVNDIMDYQVIMDYISVLSSFNYSISISSSFIQYQSNSHSLHFSLLEESIRNVIIVFHIIHYSYSLFTNHSHLLLLLQILFLLQIVLLICFIMTRIIILLSLILHSIFLYLVLFPLL